MAKGTDGIFNSTFSTGNKNILGLIATKPYDRDRNGFKLTYQPYMRRTNTSYDYETQGTIIANFYVNGKRIGSCNKSYKVPNDKNWAKICDPITVPSDVIKVGPFEACYYSVGFSSKKGTGGPNAFNVGTYDSDVSKDQPITLTTDGAGDILMIGAYATAPKSPDIEIVDNGNNTCTIKHPPKTNYSQYDGSNCYVDDCHSYYNINNSSNPTTTTNNDGSFNDSTTNWVISDWKDKPPQKFTLSDGTEIYGYQVKAIGIAIGYVDRVKETKWQGNSPEATDSDYVKYYSKPTHVTNLKLYVYNNKKPTSKTTYVCSWDHAKSNSIHSPVEGYEVIIKKKSSNGNIQDVYKVTMTGVNFPFSAEMLKGGLEKGDKLYAEVVAYSYNAKNERLDADKVVSNSITIVSSGVMFTNIGNNTWKEGQAYIKIDDTTWKEATGVYICEGNNKWKESV